MSVKYEKSGKVALITIDRPDAYNSIDLETNKVLNEVWHDFRDDSDMWVAIVTGAGEKAFCAGADLKKYLPYYANLSLVERKEMRDKGYSFGAITRNFVCWKPIIAAINGVCLGGGLEIALACDIRIASENATFGLTEPRWGIIPGGGGTQRLSRIVPLSMAMDMMLDARIIEAEEALKIGLISRLTTQEQLIDQAFELAHSICTKGPLAVRAVKESVLRGLDVPISEGFQIEATLTEFLRQTKDAKEGPKAFAEKRKPNFKCE